ncbi:MAG: OmpH family outer membrane protein [Planctomycetes bacterium]|nr:OmpH family outer membrane protein [Planctomycetota bacterium]
MNRMFIAMIGVVFAVSAASAQTARTAVSVDKTNSPKVGTTKVAVFNIGVVLGKYDRANAAKDDLTKQVKRLQAEAKELTDNLTKWQTALQAGEVPAEKKELYEEKIITARRYLEDLNREARTTIGKKQEANLIQLWKDVREAVKTYSAEHGLDLVIVYGDVTQADQLDVFPNITRKMSALDQGGSLPFFVAPGVDISEGLVQLLNRQYRRRLAEPAEQEDPQ